LFSNSPIIITFFESKEKDFNRNSFVDIRAIKDISLKMLGFEKIENTYVVYQKIDYYISNVLLKDEMKETISSDEAKILSHGFDKKISFRKSKKDK
jgi:hypothetical protein